VELLLDSATSFLNSDAESKRAAAGWAGDRYVVYEGSAPGEVFMAQLTAWDTESDAREFFDAYVKRTKVRLCRFKTLLSQTRARPSGATGPPAKADSSSELVASGFLIRKASQTQ